jgi:hypothetical protein
MKMHTVRIPALVVAALLGSCSAPVQKTPLSQESRPSEAERAAPEPAEQPFVPYAAEPSEWLGARFVLMDIAPLFRKFGYELYDSPDGEKGQGAIDGAWVNAKHRLLHQPHVGDTLVVSSATAQDSGWMVGFAHPVGNRVVYGRVMNGSLPGVVALEELEGASRRWIGKEVYARKRLVNTIDSTKGVLGSFKVSIAMPLKVIGVHPGMSPIPPLSLWVIVRTQDGREGFIPTNYGWSTIVKSRRHNRAPWDDDLLESNPREQYRWDEAIWQAIDTHKLLPGMSREQVLLSWYEPLSRTVQGEAGGSSEVWRYPAQELWFEAGALTKIIDK